MAPGASQRRVSPVPPVTDPAPWHPGRPPCKRLKTQCPEERPLETPAPSRPRSGRDPLPSPQTRSGAGPPGHSGTGRSRDLLEEPPKPCADLQGRSAPGHWAGGLAGPTPRSARARPSEEGGRGLGSGLPPPQSSGESHARTGASTVVFLNPGGRDAVAGPKRGPAWVGFEPAACRTF